MHARGSSGGASTGGHFWSLWPTVRHVVRGRHAPACAPWSTTLLDERVGRIELRGWLDVVRDAPALVVIVHGLGGQATSHYSVAGFRAARRAGLSSLRIWLRGGDRRGEDFYHAGLTADLDATLASAEVRAAPAVVLLGYSLGGHVVLRYATGRPDPRVKAVAAICAPLDLAATAVAFDEEIAWPYRAHVMRSLRSMYAAVARRRQVPTPLEVVRRARGVREWDRLTVVPRHGFASVADYYERESVAPRLCDLKVPALLVASDDDPVVPAHVLRPTLSRPHDGLDVRWTSRGGHVGFPADLDLGFTGDRGLENQVVGWLAARAQEG
jgi:hypothetical protein